MCRIILIISILIIVTKVGSQSFSDGCLTQDSHEERLSNFPELEALYYQTQNFIIEERDKNRVWPRSRYIIPIVFHVVWKEEEENVNNAQILSQLDVLNDAFQAQNFDVRYLPELFKSSIANIELSFCLASRDPNGVLHSGINRVQTDFDFIGDLENLEGKPRIKYSGLGGIDSWDPNRYINIWIGRKELGFGEATFPGATVMEEQGLIIDPYYLGTKGIGTSDPDFNKGRVAIHEMGHYFNLKHLFGDDQNCESDDNIEDTPLQSTSYSDCPGHPQISCNSADMFMNFMALTNDHCVRFFTNGQKEMMMAALNTAREGLKNSGCIMIRDSIEIINKVNVRYLFNLELIELNLELIGNEILVVSLYDITGRLYFKRAISHRIFYNINIRDLLTGIYFLELRIGDDRLVKKFYRP